MDFLNKTFAQVRELFLSMTPGARITSGLLLAVVVVSLAFLFQQGLSGPDEYLFGGEPFSGSQMPQVEAALAAAGNDFQVIGNRVKVPRGKKDIYIAAVADAGALPRNMNSIVNDAFERESALDSRETKRWQNQALRESQLSHIIGLMPWVEQATVICTIEEPRGLSSVKQASAAVSVLPNPGELLDGHRLRKLKDLAGRWHPSLSPDRVAVINLGNETYATSEVTAEDFDEDYWRIRTSYEKLKRDNILKVLGYIPGVRVQVSANLDDTIEETIRDVKPVQPGVLVSSTMDTEKNIETIPSGGGEPGLEANGPNRRGPEPALATQNKSESQRSNMKEENAVGFSESELRRGGYKEKEVFASIAVPRDYIVNVWKQRNPPTDGQPEREPDDNELKIVQTNEISKIENLVKPLLPRLTLGEDEYKQVHVEMVDPIIRQPLAEPTLANNALTWTGQNWGTLSMLGLTVFSLLMLRSLVRSSPSGEIPRAASAPMLRVETPESSDMEAAESDLGPPRQRLRLRKSHSLKEDLAEIVREDPDAAATILRNWISNAS